MSIAENYYRIIKEIPDNVTIVLAAKTRSAAEIAEAIAAGATDIGQNYVQEAEGACTALGNKAHEVRWHMIGKLQTNKIKKALKIFDVIQTIDSLDKAAAVNKSAEALGKVIPVYIEVNIGSELSKAGAEPEAQSILNLVQKMSQCNHIRVEGIMTMGPLFADPEGLRPYFRQARKIFESVQSLGLPQVNMQTLSMGMSDSYKVAIEEGATMIRLGSIIFGSRI